MKESFEEESIEEPEDDNLQIEIEGEKEENSHEAAVVIAEQEEEEEVKNDNEEDEKEFDDYMLDPNAYSWSQNDDNEEDAGDLP